MENTLSRNLEDIIKNNDKGDITVTKITEQVKEKGFGLFLVILSLPSALPIPAPGYSTPFGIILMTIGIQMALGRETPWLPVWAGKVTLKQKFAKKIAKAGCTFFGKIEYLIKPRFSVLTNKGSRSLLGMLVALMAVLMIFPIPLTNTAPAMVIFLIGIGLSEDDGLFILGSYIIGLLALLLYIFVIYWVTTFLLEQGLDAWDQLEEVIKGKLKNSFSS